MLCLRLCAHLLHLHTGIPLFDYISIQFWHDIAAKHNESWGCKGNSASMRTPHLVPFFSQHYNIKKIVCDLRKNSNLIYKRADRPHTTRYICSGTKMGEIVLRDILGMLCTWRYQTCSKCMFKTDRGRHRRDPLRHLKQHIRKFQEFCF